MSQKDMNKVFVNDCDRKGEESRVDGKKLFDVIRGKHPPQNQTPNREEIARAVSARLKEEEKKKKERREKAERQKEEIKRAKEEITEAMKREAARKAEALERRDAIKSRDAKYCAAAAAEARADKATAMEEAANGAFKILETPIRSEIQQKEEVCTSNETKLSEDNIMESTNFALNCKIKQQKEERKREEALGAKKQKAREAAAVLDRQATKAKAAQGDAAAAAYTKATVKAGAANNKQSLDRSPQTKYPEMKVPDAIKSSHIIMTGTEMISGTRHDYELEIGDKNINGNIIHNSSKEKEPASTADYQESVPMTMKIIKKAYNSNQSGAKPKEKMSELLTHTVHSQTGQNSNETYMRSSKNSQQNENTRCSQEKEIVSVMESLVPQLSGSEGQKEIVSITGHETYQGHKAEEPTRYEGGKSNIQYVEGHNKKVIKNSKIEESKQERIPGHQEMYESCNRGFQDLMHQFDSSHKSQQYYTSPAQRSRDIQNSDWQPEVHSMQNGRSFHRSYQKFDHKRQQNHNYNHDEKRQRHHSCHHYGRLRSLLCGSCGKNFNLQENLPRNLHCGHSLCEFCVITQITHGSHVYCSLGSKCKYHKKIEQFPVKEPLFKILSEQFPVNEPLFKILSEENMQNSARKNEGKEWPHLAEGSTRRQCQSQPGNATMGRSALEQIGNKSTPPRSPHGSKCMDQGVRPSFYCCTCKMWLCAKCVEVEHSHRMCSVKSLKDQLVIMKQNNENQIHREQELLNKSLRTLENSLYEDQIFLIWMRFAFDCMEKTQEYMKKELEQGRELMKALTDTMKCMSNATNLPEALASFQKVEDMSSVAQQWISSAALNIPAGQQETTTSLRQLMRRAFTQHKHQNGVAEIYAVDKLVGATLWSRLRVEGGRFHLHALEKTCPNSHGVQVLPIKCFKASQDAASTLVFLELSWGGVEHGRLYIRLIGNTLRGHQFISLCTGEEGTSFRGTCFHRVWGKGLPGETVWTGDYEKGDGSGGTSLLSPNNHEDIPAGRSVPISAGLVAGRYEKESISSIFRIYTREEKEGTDEVGFGQVEFGLNVVRKAVRLSNIRDVTISACGLVLEM